MKNMIIQRLMCSIHHHKRFYKAEYNYLFRTQCKLRAIRVITVNGKNLGRHH